MKKKENIEHEFTKNEIANLCKYLSLEKDEEVRQVHFKGSPTQYLITSYGKVISTRYRGVTGVVSILKQKIQNNGYKSIMLVIKSKHVTCLVHRLVANEFIENSDDKPEVNHINGLKTDNRVCNLEWVTEKENISHAYKHNLHAVLKGEEIANSKNKENTIIEVCKHLEENRLSLNEISELTGVTNDMIRRIKDGVSWKHVSCNYNIKNYKFGKTDSEIEAKKHAILLAHDMIKSKQYKLKEIVDKTGLTVAIIENIKSGKGYKNILKNVK